MREEKITRIKTKIEQVIADPKDRQGALELLAFAIENADDERPNAWYLKEGRHSLKLFAGRLAACRIGRGRVDLSVMGPIDDEIRAAIGADVKDDVEFSAIPGGIFLSFTVVKARTALELLKDHYDRFVDEAMARVRSTVSLDEHVPEAIAYARCSRRPVRGSMHLM